MNKSVAGMAALALLVVVVLSILAATQSTRWFVVRQLPATDFTFAFAFGIVVWVLGFLIGQSSALQHLLTLFPDKKKVEEFEAWKNQVATKAFVEAEVRRQLETNKTKPAPTATPSK